MANRNVAILKAVICVAWADGLLKDPERRAIEGVLRAVELSPAEVAELRAYAEKPHALAELDLRDFTNEDKRLAILHSVALAHADNDYSPPERQAIMSLCERFGLSPAEAHALMGRANARMGR
jgi:tellurite resistance protein